MSASSNSLDRSERFVLRWSENPASPLREEYVDVLQTDLSEALISSSLRIDEKTRVYLIRENSTESGIVRSCRPAGKKFILTIAIGQETWQPPRGPRIDPGVFIVDDFMTEEQELKILSDLDDELNGEYRRSLAAARAYLSNTRYSGTAALNRLVRFTVRSSTSLVSGGVFQVWDKFRQMAGTCTLERVQAPAPSSHAGDCSCRAESASLQPNPYR